MPIIVFTITLFVSAFLLFLVQPMIGKMILPKLGGTPQVWNTCMLFFQTVLLAGYFYTHATTTYLRPRKQMMLHGALLFLPLIVMLAIGRFPFDVKNWTPPAGSNPIFATLLLLLIIVGVPFFVVSTSAPLLQKWFSFSGHPTANDPYFLYGASNFGSLLSLAAYPFLVEPWFAVPTQTWIWFVGYISLMILFFGSASLVWKQADVVTEPAVPAGNPDPLPAMSSPPAPAVESSTAIQPSRLAGKKKGLKAGTATAVAPTPPKRSIQLGPDPQTAPVTLGRCLRWALLAAVPSSLMLGVTSYISTDLSPFPLVWAIPLALYLLTFILVFAKWPLEWTQGIHPLVLVVTPIIAVPILCLVLFTRNYTPVGLGTALAFFTIFVITLAMHGELAKDRPAARKLTLFFLLMSFGGMLGGLFNAMIAPVIFTGIWEYPLAIIAACLLLPNLMDRGFTDGLIMDALPDLEKSMTEASDNIAKSFGKAPEGKPFLFHYFWDILIGGIIALIAWYTTAASHAAQMRDITMSIFSFLGFSERDLAFSFRSHGFVYLMSIYGVPLILSIIVSARSWRMGIGIAGLLFFGYIMQDRGALYSGRSYFGVLKVLSDVDYIRDEKGRPVFTEAEDLPKTESAVPYNYLMHGSTYHGRNYQVDELARLATTYYHRFGPVGVIMEKYNWLPGKQNTYDADVRMPASMVGLGVPMGLNVPLEMLTDSWSEPPYATVGLGTGTMASYGRPFQHVAYYEIDDKIKALSVPKKEGDKLYFRYVDDALKRGANVEIIMGDARLSLEREAEREKERLAKGETASPTAMRDGYYKVIVLDAFSSDAIPVHLITEEAIKLYMQKLAPDGILCVHTSNRHLELIKPVADIANAQKLDWMVAHDAGGSERSGRPRNEENRVHSLGHFSSEYIMLARKQKDGSTLLDKTKLENAINPPAYKGMVTSIIRDRKGDPANGIPPEKGWYKLPAPMERIWTDNYQNIVSIMR